MRAFALVVLAGLAVAMPTAVSARPHACASEAARLCRHAAAPWRYRHEARYRRSHVARAFHIPRFDQGEAEDFVHTTYPYRTGLYVPWPDAVGAYYPY